MVGRLVPMTTVMAPFFRTSRPWQLITAAAAILGIAAALASLVSGLPALLVWNTAWTAAAVSAVAGTLAARAATAGHERRRWTWWTVASASWLAGQITWNVLGVAASPSIADLGWWLFAVLIMGGLLAAHPGTRGQRRIAVLEALPLIAAVMALTCAWLWDEAAASQLPTAARVSVLVYPALYVSAAVLTLQALVAGSLRGTTLVLVGMVLNAVAFIVWSPELLGATYVVGENAIDPLWVAGMTMIGLGGALAASRADGAEAATYDAGRRGGILPAAVFVLLIGSLVAAETGNVSVRQPIVLAVGLFTCGALLIARAVLLDTRMRRTLERERVAVRELAVREADLARLNRRLSEDSRRDPLTGFLNRRALEADLPPAGGAPVAFALCDVDRFKTYNDRLGHLAGDQALRTIADAIRRALREEDAAYRYGGEELLLVLRTGELDAAAAVAERVRAAVEALALPHPDGIGGVLTVSVGVAVGPPVAGRLFEEADDALYDAKAGGRNRVATSTPEGTRTQRVRRAAAGVDEPVLRHLRGALAIGRAAATGRGAVAVAETLVRAIRSESMFETVVVDLGDDLHAVQDATEAVSLPGGAVRLPLRASTGDLLGVVSLDQPHSGRQPDESELAILMALAEHAAVALERVGHEEALLGVTRELPEDRLAAVTLLAETLDLRDAGTSRHSQTVGRYARDTAAALGLPAERVERIRAAGIVHDLGKLGVSDAILLKPSALDDAEWREMKRHPEIGARILDHSGLGDLAAWVRAHHERVDGRGYPLGLVGDQIPLEARILAVADAYEAMTADRPYRAGMPPAEADEELRRGSGTQFDARVVAAFLLAVRSAAAVG